jgi:hypothetical protein
MRVGKRLWKEKSIMRRFGVRDFGEANDRRQQPQSPVGVVLGIREELAEFRRNGGKQALLAKWRKACEEALLQTMRGLDPGSFEQALAGPDGIIEHLRDRGVIPPARSRWPGKPPAGGVVLASPVSLVRRRRQRDGGNG